VDTSQELALGAPLTPPGPAATIAMFVQWLGGETKFSQQYRRNACQKYAVECTSTADRSDGRAELVHGA